MGQVTEHFTSEEFACHDGTAYPAEWVQERLVPLCGVLEVIRAAAGGAVSIDSGFRTLAYDARLYAKSAKDGLVAKPESSQHPMGRAADIVCATMKPKALHALILQLYAAGKIPALGGIGLYPTFVHVDVRPHTGHLAQWGGDRDSNIA